MSGKRAIVIVALAAACLGLGWCVAGRRGFFVRPGGGGQLGFPESSGLVSSRTHPGVFWTHADSGTPPVILAVDGQGQLLGEFRVEGVRNRDWEDIALDDTGNLYVADSGNNGNARRDLVVYRLREPDPASVVEPDGQAGEGRSSVDHSIEFRYPDQFDFPASVRNFDAEALFWARGRLYLLTKHRADTNTTLYRFPALDGRSQVVLDKISEFDLGGGDLQFGGMATAADATPDGGRLAVLTYHALFVFEAPERGDDYLVRLVKRIDLEMTTLGQCEGVAWDGEDLVITNEAGRLFRVETALDPSLTHFPVDE